MEDSKKTTAPKTRKTRVQVPLSDFGKLVAHHLIDNGMTMSQMEKAAGMSPAKFRKVLTGSEKPPREWIRNNKLDPFLRQAAADAYSAEIEDDYQALQAFSSAG